MNAQHPGEDVTATERECPRCGGRFVGGSCAHCALVAHGEGGLGVNEYGTPVSIHVCSACGDEFTVCPPAGPNFGTGCLAPLCPSYDIERDVDYLLAAGQRLIRDDEGDGR